MATIIQFDSGRLEAVVTPRSEESRYIRNIRVCAHCGVTYSREHKACPVCKEPISCDMYTSVYMNKAAHLRYTLLLEGAEYAVAA